MGCTRNSGLGNGVGSSPQITYEQFEFEQKVSENEAKAKNNETYNEAGSKSVREVKIVKCQYDGKSLPVKSELDSVIKDYKNGKIVKERFFDENGDVYLDIDYTNHNNSKTHPIVPHEHRWVRNNKGKLERTKWEDINK